MLLGSEFIVTDNGCNKLYTVALLVERTALLPSVSLLETQFISFIRVLVNEEKSALIMALLTWLSLEERELNAGMLQSVFVCLF